jgi:hypothetical protein
VRAEADAIPSAGAEDGAKTNRGEDGEEESGKPVWEADRAKGIPSFCLVDGHVAEAEEPGGSDL